MPQQYAIAVPFVAMPAQTVGAAIRDAIGHRHQTIGIAAIQPADEPGDSTHDPSPPVARSPLAVGDLIVDCNPKKP